MEFPRVCSILDFDRSSDAENNPMLLTILELQVAEAHVRI